ncbi:phage holin [Bacillus infantis]|uniref:phage holin n=1 Tax=Bacillus infantis TaxID=324767 RepID=UPI00101C4BD6|nr:phage holin [Bacillus infantis]RYI32030.1 phage holin [Bacillus infantis]
MEDYIIKGLTYLLIALTNVVVGYVILFLRKHKVIKELEAHKEIVAIGVTAVQEAYSHMDGTEKFKLAKQWITKTAAAKGLKIDEKQIDFLIDAVVKEAKISFGEAWKEEK